MSTLKIIASSLAILTPLPASAGSRISTAPSGPAPIRQSPHPFVSLPSTHTMGQQGYDAARPSGQQSPPSSHLPGFSSGFERDHGTARQSTTASPEFGGTSGAPAALGAVPAPVAGRPNFAAPSVGTNASPSPAPYTTTTYTLPYSTNAALPRVPSASGAPVQAPQAPTTTTYAAPAAPTLPYSTSSTLPSVPSSGYGGNKSNAAPPQYQSNAPLQQGAAAVQANTPRAITAPSQSEPYYIESTNGAVLTAEQIATKSFPAGTFFVGAVSGEQYTPQQLGARQTTTTSVPSAAPAQPLNTSPSGNTQQSSQSNLSNAPSNSDAAYYIQSGTGAHLTASQISGGTFPPGTFFISSTGQSLTAQQIAKAPPAASPSTPGWPNTGFAPNDAGQPAYTALPPVGKSGVANSTPAVTPEQLKQSSASSTSGLPGQSNNVNRNGPSSAKQTSLASQIASLDVSSQATTALDTLAYTGVTNLKSATSSNGFIYPSNTSTSLLQQQCAVLVQAIEPGVGLTSTWKPGQPASGALPIGTPIATFTPGPNPSYPGQTGILDPTLPATNIDRYAHAAIYMGPASNGGAYILDQHAAFPAAGVPAEQASVHEITASDLARYSTILQ